MTMNEIDSRVLHHIGRYILTLQRVLQIELFDGVGDPQPVLDRLQRTGYIQCEERSLVGNFSYYHLTKRGAASINISENRAKPKQGKGLAQDLAALWFACMGEGRRKRLFDSELKTLFGPPKGGNVIHIAQEDEPTIYRLFVPEPDTNLQRYSTTLKRAAHEAGTNEQLVRWIERGTFQFAVLLNTEERLNHLAELIRSEEYPDLRIHLAIAPSPRDMPRFLPPKKEVGAK